MGDVSNSYGDFAIVNRIWRRVEIRGGKKNILGDGAVTLIANNVTDWLVETNILTSLPYCRVA